VFHAKHAHAKPGRHKKLAEAGRPWHTGGSPLQPQKKRTKHKGQFQKEKKRTTQKQFFFKKRTRDASLSTAAAAPPRRFSLPFRLRPALASRNGPSIKIRIAAVRASAAQSAQMERKHGEEQARVVKLRAVEATPESFAPFGQVITGSPDGDEFGPHDAQLDLSRGIPRY
jgi:uncharacterized protein with WD repeat